MVDHHDAKRRAEGHEDLDRLGGPDGCDPGMLTPTAMADDQNPLSRFGGHAANVLQDDLRGASAWSGVQAYGCDLGVASLSLKPMTHPLSLKPMTL